MCLLRKALGPDGLSENGTSTYSFASVSRYSRGWTESAERVPDAPREGNRPRGTLLLPSTGTEPNDHAQRLNRSRRQSPRTGTDLREPWCHLGITGHAKMRRNS